MKEYEIYLAEDKRIFKVSAISVKMTSGGLIFIDSHERIVAFAPLNSVVRIIKDYKDEK